MVINKKQKFCSNCNRYENGEGKKFYTACGNCSRNWNYHDNWEPIKATEQTDAPEPRIKAARPGNP